MKLKSYSIIKNIFCCCIFLLAHNFSYSQEPDIEWFYNPLFSSYPTFCEDGQIFINLENKDDSVAVDAYNLELILGFAETLISTPKKDDCVSLNGFKFGGLFDSADIFPDTNFTNNYTLLLSNFDEDPDGFGGLEDLDNDGEYDDLPAGAKTTLILNSFFEESCLKSCPPVVIPPKFLRLRTKGETADNESFTKDYLKESPSETFFFFADEQDTFGELGESYQCGDEVILTLSLQKFMVDMSPICPDEISKLFLKIPPTLVPAGDPVLLPPFADLTWEMTGDTMVISGDFTSAYLEIPFEAQADNNASSFCTSADSVGTLYDIPFWLNYFCDAANCDDYWQLYCGTSEAFSVDCNGQIPPDVAGVFTQNFQAERVTLGWTDSLMTTQIDPNAANIRLDNALTFDKVKWTANATIGGNVPTDSLIFNWQYQPLGNNDSQIFNYLEGIFQLFKNNTQTWHECNFTATIPSLENNLYKWRFDLTQFFKNGACLEGFILEEGDELICEFFTQVRDDFPTGNHKVEQLKGYFSFAQNMDFLTCGVSEAQLNVIRIRGNQPQISDPEFELLCDQIQVEFPFYFGHSDFGIFDYFPDEFRPAGRIDSILVSLPVGLEYLTGSAQISHTWRAPGSLISTQLMANSIPDPLLILQNGQPHLLFKNEENWPQMDYTKAKSFYNLRFELRPNCQLSDAPIIFSPETSFTENVWSENPADFESDTETGFFNLESPNNFPTIHLIDSVFSVASNLANWTFEICNENAESDLPNVWLALETPTTGFEIVEILENGNVLPILDYQNSENKWVKLETLDTETCKEIQVSAQFRRCDFDTLLIRLGFNCFEYPIAPDVGYGNENYTCPEEEKTDTLLLENVPFEADIEILSPITCYGEMNAEIAFSTNVEPLDLTWQWNQNLPNDSIQNNLSAGFYEVTVSNGFGCEDVVDIEIEEPEELLLSAQITTNYNGFSVSCGGYEDGEVEAEVSGGVAPYLFEWSNGNADSIAQNLPADLISVTVTDAYGCQKIERLNLTEPTPIEISATVDSVNCHNTQTGNISTDVSGDAPPFNYEWQNGSTSEDLENISAGIWELTVTDANDCSQILTTEVFEPNPLDLQFSVEEIQCFEDENGAISVAVNGGEMPYQYSWSNDETQQNITNLSAGNYSVTITDAQGCNVSDTIILENPEPLDFMLELKSPSCINENNGAILTHIFNGTAPISFIWSTGATENNLENLSAGLYEVTVSDGNNCTTTENATLEEPYFPNIEIQQIPISCFNENDGEIFISETSETTYLTFSLDNQNFQSELFFENLGADNYTIFVKDSLDCVQSFESHLANPPMLLLDLPPQIELSLGEAANLKPQTNQSNLIWEWFPLEGLSCGDCENPVAAPLVNTNYEVTASNSNGCTAATAVEIMILRQPDIHIPNAFSPNNDGVNDHLKIFPAASVAEISSFRIFNRWGGLVSETTNLPVENEFSVWDGRQNGKLLERGVYIFEMEIGLVDGKRKRVSGDVTLAR